MSEFGFELSLCAHLEATREAIVSRQLGASVAGHARRVLDVVVLEPGPRFEDRTALTASTIPDRLLTDELGPGRFRDWRRVIGSDMGARRAVERGVEIGYLERDRRRGRELIRPVDRYPNGWFDRLIAIENKPDLGAPGDLYNQLQFDVSLGLVDAAILVTESHVTRAHRHRLPDAIGIWRFDPDTSRLDVVQSPDALPSDRPGIERLEHRSNRTEIAIVETDDKNATRCRLAERAYGKGWRQRTWPGCGEIDPDNGPAPGTPWCSFKGRLVDPAAECGEACPGFAANPPPAVHREAIRAEHSPWRRDPPDRRRQQVGLPQFED